MPQPGITDSSDEIFTGSQAAKCLGIPLSTLRRLIRDGTLWTTPMTNGGMGLSKSELQRFIDRHEKSAQRAG